MRLAVISHTAHYRDREGRPVGWGPTIREIDHLCEVFESIEHVAVLRAGTPPPSAIGYSTDRVTFTPLTPTGGPRWRDKFDVVWRAPETIYKVQAAVRRADAFQFRAPTGIGTFIVPWLALTCRKPGWFKYAGNWNQAAAPAGYRLQRFWLRLFRRHAVTLNGSWPGMPAHAISFENPCLARSERDRGRELLDRKDFSKGLSAAFVGRVEESKGILRAVDSLTHERVKARVERLHIVGDGSAIDEVRHAAKRLGVPIVIHGQVPRREVAEVLAESHLLLLPSDSEGFPKVVAEAWNYGCVPVVSDVSAIGQYVHRENGYLWRMEKEPFGEFLGRQDLTADALERRAVAGFAAAAPFTFEHYNRRIAREVLGR